MRLNGEIGGLWHWLAAAGFEPCALGEAAVVSALKRRLAAAGCTAATYPARLAADADERARLLEAVLVPETWFFREAPGFDALVAAAAQHRLERRTGPFRVLSLGCSTGEEPWSIVIALREAGMENGDFRVEALDISARAIEAARAGIYGGRSFRRPGDGAWRSRYFDELGDGRYRVKDALRGDVEFRVVHLGEAGWGDGGRRCQAVFCRNVLIYLKADLRARVIARCHEVLDPGGLLVLGHADGIGGFEWGFRRHGAAGAFSWIRQDVTGAKILPTSPSRLVPVEAAKCGAGGGSRPAGPVLSLGAEEIACAVPLADGGRLSTARALADGGDYTAAERLCLGYLASHPDDPEVHALLGIVMSAANREDDALKYFRQALYLAPSHSESLLHLAALYERRGDGERARHFRNRSAAEGGS
ncbi:MULTISPECIES: CheR family methyltransferase [Methylococcus]|uniref:Tetratricopeptide repeat protein n=1 Tax=Methylococcus capsulatus TaxID=414 RepID=A0ABZ2F0Z9_METCP|nr:protein-glutamate O-methyltransferase CheR [Methylococcus capsulatus]